MEFKDIVRMYEDKKKQYGEEAYRYISDIFEEAHPLYIEEYLSSARAKKKREQGRITDAEQSWKPFKGKSYENLIVYIIKEEIERLGLKWVKGDTLEKSKASSLSKELSTVKRNLLVDFGEYGAHLPDVDIAIYRPGKCEVLAAISSKITLRERIAQTGYWKIKLSADQATKHIKVYFITPDEDGSLVTRFPAKKGRAIVEMDTDGSYAMSKVNVEESPKVKMFNKFVKDLRDLVNG